MLVVFFYFIVAAAALGFGPNLEIPPSGEHKYTLIYLHGMGASSEFYRGFFEKETNTEIPLDAPRFVNGGPWSNLTNVKVVLPNAPIRHSCYKDWCRNTSSWFDMWFNSTKHRIFPELMKEGKKGAAFEAVISEYNQTDL